MVIRPIQPLLVVKEIKEMAEATACGLMDVGEG